MKKIGSFLFSILFIIFLTYCGGNKGNLSTTTPSGGQAGSSGGQTGSTTTGAPPLVSQSIGKLSDDLTRYTWSTILAGTYASTRREEYCSMYDLCYVQQNLQQNLQKKTAYPIIVEHLYFNNGMSGTLVDGTGSLSLFGLLQPVGSNLLSGSTFEIPFKISNLTEDITNNTFDMSLEVDTSSATWSHLPSNIQSAFQTWTETFSDLAFLPPRAQPFAIFTTRDRFSYGLIFIPKDLHASMQDILSHQSWETLARTQDRTDMCNNNPVFCFDPGTKTPYDILVEHIEFLEDPQLPGFIHSGVVYYYGLMGSYTSGQTPLPSTPTFEASFTLEDAVYPSGSVPLFDLEWRYDSTSSWAGSVARLRQITWTQFQDAFECLTGTSQLIKRTYKGM